METGFEPGMPVSVMRPNGAIPAAVPSTVVHARPDALALQVGAGHDWVEGEQVILAAGEVGQRMIAPATFLAARRGVAVFALRGAWAPFDVREGRRYPLDAPAEIRSVLGQSRQQGRVVDLSSGGLGMLVPAKPGGKSLEVGVQFSGYAARLPCELVGLAPRGNMVLLHLKFGKLTAAQQAFVRNVLAVLAAREHEGGLANAS